MKTASVSKWLEASFMEAVRNSLKSTRSRKRKIELMAGIFRIPMKTARDTVFRRSLYTQMRKALVQTWPRDDFEWIERHLETPNETSNP